MDKMSRQCKSAKTGAMASYHVVPVRMETREDVISEKKRGWTTFFSSPKQRYYYVKIFWSDGATIPLETTFGEGKKMILTARVTWLMRNNRGVLSDNNRGPRTEPRGTPDLKWAAEEQGSGRADSSQFTWA